MSLQFTSAYGKLQNDSPFTLLAVVLWEHQNYELRAKNTRPRHRLGASGKVAKLRAEW